MWFVRPLSKDLQHPVRSPSVRDPRCFAVVAARAKRLGSETEIGVRRSPWGSEDSGGEVACIHLYIYIYVCLYASIGGRLQDRL